MATKRQTYEARQKAFKTTAHSFNRKVCSWAYCSGCGLVALNNDATRKRLGSKWWTIETNNPDWSIPGAEYSFTPFEEEK